MNAQIKMRLITSKYRRYKFIHTASCTRAQPHTDRSPTYYFSGSAIGRGCVITRYWTSVTPAGRIRCLVLGFEWVCFGWGNLVGGLFRGSEGTEIARIGGI